MRNLPPFGRGFSRPRLVLAGLLPMLLCACGGSKGGGGSASPAGTWSVEGALITWDHGDIYGNIAPAKGLDTWTVVKNGNTLDLTSVNLKSTHLPGQVTSASDGGHYEGAVDIQPNIAGAKVYLHMTWVLDVHMVDGNTFHGTEVIDYYGYLGNNPALGMNPVPTSESWALDGTRVH